MTILRTAPLLGPTVENYLTRYLSRRLVPTMMGFDPLLQFVHEVDALAAFKLAIDRDVPGVFNIVADGVLPLSTVIKLAGRIAVPIPHPLAETGTAIAWMAQLADAPPSFLKYLRFLCVADGKKAWDVMGFRPAYATREALLDFTSAQRLRDVVEGAHPVQQCIPQVCVVQSAQRVFTLFETAGSHRFTVQVSAEHSGELLGVPGLMDNDVAHRPGFTPGAGVGPVLLQRLRERPPLRKSVFVDLSAHGLGYTRRHRQITNDYAASGL